MAKTIQQTVRFGVSPERLFDIYMDSKKHAATTDSTAAVSRKVGGSFAAFKGGVRGKNLAIVPRRLIVQAARGAGWTRSELDSILILKFDRARGGGRIRLVHANVPDRYHAMIKRGWNEYYWKRWRAYLRRGGRPAR